MRGLAQRPSVLEAVKKASGPLPDAEAANDQKPGGWTACKIDYQIKSTKRFAIDELSLLDASLASSLFAPGKLAEATRGE